MKKTIPVVVKGFSLVELMVSILIGLIVLAGVVQVILSSKRSYLDNQDIAYIQDNTRYVLDMMSKDIRLAGYKGCATLGASVSNVIESDVLPNIMGANSTLGFLPLIGFQEIGVPTEFSDRITDTDSIIVRRGAAENETVVRNHNSLSNTITVWDVGKLIVNEPAMIVDAKCQNVGIFMPTSISGKDIKHEKTGKNCNSNLKGGTNCSASTVIGDKQYQVGSRIMPFSVSGYFIARSKINNLPVLKRMSTRIGASGLEAFSEEIAQGVSQMSILYGVSDVAGEVVSFVPADSVASDKWDEVTVIKISLTFSSVNPQAPGQNNKFDKVVTSTIQIRNRI